MNRWAKASRERRKRSGRAVSAAPSRAGAIGGIEIPADGRVNNRLLQQGVEVGRIERHARSK